MPETVASTYTIIEEIGSGGGGIVYLAEHNRLNKKVILKVDKRKLSTRPELLRREVDVLKDLTHTYIPKVYDFFTENEQVYTVMDYIEGESLDRPLKRGERFEQKRVIKWAKELLTALEYLHSPTHGEPPRGFVHSDIKPANLMRTPYDDICLIDFNIALALGEENVVGCSAGYASPEHYGLDYSSGLSGGSGSYTYAEHSGDTATVKMSDSFQGSHRSSHSSRSVKTVVPDVRSDIYSVGATLYHLLSGVRPASDALKVEPLPESEVSRPLIEIVEKAMKPNPDERYQTAAQMLWDLEHLRERDPRWKSFKRARAATAAVLAVIFAAGAFTAFTGSKRMSSSKDMLLHAQNSEKLLSDGDRQSALEEARLSASFGSGGLFAPEVSAEAGKALADALGVYDVSDSFELYRTIALKASPFYTRISPDGRTALCASLGALDVIDTDSAEITDTLEMLPSSLAEAEFADNERFLFAGAEGLCLYDIKTKESKLLAGQVSAVCVSGDGRTAAALLKNENTVIICDLEAKSVTGSIDIGGALSFGGSNEAFVSPDTAVFELNNDGSMLAVSCSDGSLSLISVSDPNDIVPLLDGSEGYESFSGGFCGSFFAFAGVQDKSSSFAVVDIELWEQKAGFTVEYPLKVRTDANGIYLSTNDLLVNYDPDTGQDIPLVTMSEYIDDFSVDSGKTAAVSGNGLYCFSDNAVMTASFTLPYRISCLSLGSGTLITGGIDSLTLNILKYKERKDSEIIAYDPSYIHSEARVSADMSRVMLFSVNGFRIYGKNGELINETELPDKMDIYDQQYIHSDGSEQLEVTYYDGKKLIYSALDGELIKQEQSERPDGTLNEEFYTDRFRIDSPSGAAPTVYYKERGERFGELAGTDTLTYVTQSGDYIIAQYIAAGNEALSQYYGVLMNGELEVLARLPYLRDVSGGRLIFDYPTGNLRYSRIYDINELIQLAEKGQ